MSARRYPPPRHPHPVFDRLRASTGLNDAGLAVALGIEATDLGKLRRTGNNPYRAIIAAVRARVLDVDLHWLFTGRHDHPEATA